MRVHAYRACALPLLLVWCLLNCMRGVYWFGFIWLVEEREGKLRRGVRDCAEKVC